MTEVCRASEKGVWNNNELGEIQVLHFRGRCKGAFSDACLERCERERERIKAPSIVSCKFSGPFEVLRTLRKTRVSCGELFWRALISRRAVI